MDERLTELESNPGDWHLRSTLASEFYEAEKYEEAARLIQTAPAIPGDEDNIVFAATIYCATEPDAALAMLEDYVQKHGTTDRVEHLRSHLKAHSGDADRTFVVKEGKIVGAAEAEPATRDKVSAIIVAAAIHLVLVALLAFWKASDPPSDPPLIIASAAPSTEESSIENPILTKIQPKSASSSSSVMPVLSSQSFSDFAVPQTFEPGTSLDMGVMVGESMGFGMSMDGFGDVSNMGAIPAGMRSRCSMSQRMARLRESGGEDRAERAVRDGLEYLTTQQDKETGAFGKEYTAGMTGLALLAYLGHCETPESPKFGDSVVKAAMFLMERCQENDGQITNGKKGHHEAYEHAIGTYALCELHTMTKESGKKIPKLDSILRKAVGVIVDGQKRSGGWPYGFKGEGKEDMSVSGWQIQALKAAHNTGENFSGVSRALDKAIDDYLPEIQDSKGAFKYNPDDPNGKPTLTGAALLAMQIWDAMDTKEYEKGLTYLADHYKNPSPGNNYYAPYYNTQAFFMEEGEKWENYNSKFQPRLLDAQNEDGSWLNDAARTDGQIMNTAWAILMLEVYYRYLPTTDKVKDLKVR